jgi:NTE family protein
VQQQRGHRLTDDIGAADDDGVLAFDRSLGAHEQLDDACGRARREAVAILQDAARGDGAETVDGTGQTVTWVQGRDIQEWERPNRIGVNTTITVDHIMASMALPFLFPAVRIGDAWYGDGGVRLSHPLSPAIYLGADRILAITTRYDRSRSEADVPSVYGYPPAAQIFSLLMNAVFLDTLDQDILTLERINRLVVQLPKRHHMGLRPIRLLVIRPSVDLGKLAGEYEADLTGVIRLLARGLGSADTKSPDWLSMLLLVPEYTRRLIETGHRDAAQQHDQSARFLAE